ncbi:hypothetical protein Tco_0090445 [Tanacetum coccineum]
MNEKFLDTFANAHGFFLPYLISDHSPAMLMLPIAGNNKKRAFRFANYIADKSDFLETRNGNLFVKSALLKGKLKATQSILDSNPHNMEHRMEAIKVYNEYTSVAEDDLKLLHQKVRIQWLKEGDKNNSYFHIILKSRKHKGRVEFICGEDGSRYEGREIAGQFVKHFPNFLGTNHYVINMSSLGDIVSLKLTKEEAVDMIREVNDKEIKEAIFDIDSNKVVGPDGYSSCFFKKSWEIIGKDVCKAIKEFFITGKLLREINATLITLVPKVDTPEKVSDFRLIACCNVIYKVISKILKSRIKVGMSIIVSMNQSAILPGRHI